jgi:DMSO/TMAO reductase YedYZ molybdopterin-dependent catalytic subunit
MGEPIRTTGHVRRRATRALLAVLTLAACVAGIWIAGCSPGRQNGGGAPKDPPRPAPLAPAEVREYRGAKLSSVDDFRENSIKGPQRVDEATYRLKVRGLVQTPLELTYEQVLDRQTYDKVVTLNCVEGWSVDIWWEGVLISDLLDEAGARPRATVVIFRAADGYSSSLPLSYVEERKILLAAKMNGVKLPAERGFPFQVVAEDKWGYKWVKWVEEIELSDDGSFRGYWEQRGYSNDGSLGGSFAE